ncbi:MAG TPA: TIGR03085 family metal-binding protein [Pseudonocardiaceae bacterium]|jgi:uncharacterized protein (TIGR03085 family)|nr:TIGR03085 family metal-binding protein [Pseudonocardiaceae bacterium]
MGVAVDERNALCDLFAEVGPDAPTLCTGWSTRDLAAHLVVRDRRPDTLPGVALKSFAPHTAKVQGEFAAKPWDELVELVRTGPPRWSPLSLRALGEQVNSAEFFVHHEDVRRAQPDWQPRPADPARDAMAWRTARGMSRLSFRRSPVGVVLRRPDGTEAPAKQGPGTVTLNGEPGELLLFAFGRDAVRIEFDGEPESVSAVKGLKRGF